MKIIVDGKTLDIEGQNATVIRECKDADGAPFEVRINVSNDTCGFEILSNGIVVSTAPLIDSFVKILPLTHAKIKTIIQELIAHCLEMKIGAEAFDERIHEIKGGEEAAAINNGGLESQFQELFLYYGEDAEGIIMSDILDDRGVK